MEQENKQQQAEGEVTKKAQSVQSYCMKCRQVQPSEVVEITSQSKHPDKTQMMKGKCTVCGTKTSIICKKQQAEAEVKAE